VKEEECYSGTNIDRMNWNCKRQMSWNFIAFGTCYNRNV